MTGDNLLHHLREMHRAFSESRPLSGTAYAQACAEAIETIERLREELKTVLDREHECTIALAYLAADERLHPDLKKIIPSTLHP